MDNFKMLDLKKIIFIIIILILNVVVVSSEIFGYNLLPQPTFNNKTAFVNISNFWNTNIGILGNVNATEFNNVGGTLTIDVSWLEALTDSRFLRLDGTNTPTAAYSWTTALITIQKGTFADVKIANHQSPTTIIYVGSDNDLEADTEFVWDTSNGRLGILQGSPQFNLDVAGTGNFDDSVQINTDLGSLFFGAGQDASINYDGTNIIFDSQIVGSGDFIFNNGDVRINSQAIIRNTVNALDVQNTANAVSNQVAIFRSANRITALDFDEGYISLMNDNNEGNQQEFNRITFVATDVSPTTKDGRMVFSSMLNDVMTHNFWGESGKLGVGPNIFTPTGDIEIRNTVSGTPELRIMEAATQGFIFRYFNSVNRFDYVSLNGGVETIVMNWKRNNGFTNIGAGVNTIGQLKVESHLTTTPTLVIKGKASQSADLFQIIDSSSNELFIIEVDGDVNIDSDTASLFFGESQDASINYDGTNMIFNSQDVGTGDYFFNGGDVNIAGDLITSDGGKLSSTATCTIITSPDGTTTFEVCNA